MPKNLKLENGRIACNPQSTSGHETANLVSVLNHTVVTSSLIVAEYFGKRHCDILRAISLLECGKLFRQRNFALSNYAKKNGNISKSYPMYYLTRDGFTFLAMGFTGKVAAKFKEAYIEAFNDMERRLQEQKSTKYAEKLLKKYINKFNKHMECVKGNANYMSYDCLYPHIYNLDGETFENNLRNIFAQVANSYLSGMNAAASYFKTENELKELKREIAGIAQKARVTY